MAMTPLHSNPPITSNPLTMADRDNQERSGDLHNNASLPSHELQDLARGPRAGEGHGVNRPVEASDQTDGPQTGTRRSRPLDEERYRRAAWYNNDPRRTLSVTFAGSRAFWRSWAQELYFRGFTHPDTQERLKQNDTRLIADLHESSLSDQTKIDILSEISQEMMLRDECRKSTDVWGTFYLAVASAALFAVASAAVSGLYIRGLQNDNAILSRQLSECLKANDEWAASAAGTATVTLGQEPAAKWIEQGADEVSGSTGVSDEPEDAEPKVGLTTGRNTFDGEAKRWADRLTEGEFRDAIRSFMEVGVEYFSRFDNPEDQMNSILDDPIMGEVLSTLGMSAKQYTTFCSALMQSIPEADAADSTVAAATSDPST